MNSANMYFVGSVENTALDIMSQLLNTNQEPFKIGYVPLIDSAPLLVAQEEGFFEKEGVSVNLFEEVGWATVRDKLIYGELDMASCLIGLPYALHHGVGCIQTPMTIPLILSTDGNGVTLSKELSAETLENPEQLKSVFAEGVSKKNRKWTFATVNPYSSHLILLCHWLNETLKDYVDQIDIVFVPPQLTPNLLKDGMIDGYCVGEPWNSIAESRGDGWIVATSLSLSPRHPEKVLAVPQRVYQGNKKGVAAISKALLKACELCMSEEYHGSLVRLLSEIPHLDMKPEDISQCIKRQFVRRDGASSTLGRFYGEDVNIPSSNKEQWIIKGLKESGLFRKKIIKTGSIMKPELLFS